MFTFAWRRPAPSPNPPEPVLLRAGQTLQRLFPAGVHLQLFSGQITVQEPPLWLAERVWQATHRLASGQGHVLARGGWVSLWAHEDALLRIHLPPITPPACGSGGQTRSARPWPLRRWR